MITTIKTIPATADTIPIANFNNSSELNRAVMMTFIYMIAVALLIYTEPD